MFLNNDELYPSPLKFFSEVKKVTKNIRILSAPKTFQPLVLIVEDDDDTRLMLKYLLEIWDYRVIEAATGEEALELTRSRKPDVVLMDYKLPQIDGLTTTERIREFSNNEETVIIFVSACSEKKVRASVLARGANDYLVKPIDFGDLEISLEKHLKNKVGKRSADEVLR